MAKRAGSYFPKGGHSATQTESNGHHLNPHVIVHLSVLGNTMLLNPEYQVFISVSFGHLVSAFLPAVFQ